MRRGCSVERRASRYLSATGFLHRFTVRICCETARNSCETAARQPRNSRNTLCETCKTPAKHLRNTRETLVKHPRDTPFATVEPTDEHLDLL